MQRTPEDVATDWLEKFVFAISKGFQLEEVFVVNSIWRDLLAFTPDYRTIESIDRIHKVFAAPVAKAQPHQFRLLPGIRTRRPVPSRTFLQGLLSFQTIFAECTGIFTLVETEISTWKAWAFVTMVETPHGAHERFKHFSCPKYRALPTISVLDNNILPEYGAVVVGAGQAGLATAAHLENFGISALVVEQAARVGDSWRMRYPSLEVNTPKSFSHLPFVPFPEEWPQFFSANDVADHLEMYPAVLGLKVVTSAYIQSTAYDNSQWLLTVNIRHVGTKVISTRHVIIASGVDTLAGGSPFIPKIPHQTVFSGEIIHSSAFMSGNQWKDRNVVIVGAGCSGHDIVQHLCQVGAKRVTFVQRSSTAVISRQTLCSFFPGLYFGSDLPPTDVADRYWIALPSVASRSVQHEVMNSLSHIDRNLLIALSEKGYLLPGEEDNFLERLLIRRGGYYIDHGCCALILSGEVTMKSGTSINKFSTRGLVFNDGTEVEADLVVFATGFEPTTTKTVAGEVLGAAIAENVPSLYGWDEEWEFSGLWRPCGHQGLWFAGGDLFTSRFYSRLLAIQIKATE